MAWNKPNGNGKDNQRQDPWTGGQKQSGPPKLDEAFLKLQKKLTGLLGGVKRQTTSGSGSPPTSEVISYGLIAGIMVLLWFFSGIFIVDPAEQAVVLRFGKYLETVGPGPHWFPRFIESVYVVNEQKILAYSYDAQMLTQDENIISVALVVQYRINNARDYLFQVVNPRGSLEQATASALRQVIGHTPLDLVLTSGREQVRQEVKTILEQTLQRYNAGLLVTDVVMQSAKAPEEVKEAFDDAIKAQEDEKRFQNQAQAYAMQVEPIAQGQAQRLLADAQAYKQQVLLHAKGDVTGYLLLLPEYQKATTVTRERLYLDTLESIFSKVNKILIDGNSGNNMFYLPLDKLFSESKVAAQPTVAASAPQTTVPVTAASADTSLYSVKGGYQ